MKRTKAIGRENTWTWICSALSGDTQLSIFMELTQEDEDEEEEKAIEESDGIRVAYFSIFNRCVEK